MNVLGMSLRNMPCAKSKQRIVVYAGVARQSLSSRLGRHGRRGVMGAPLHCPRRMTDQNYDS